LPTDFQELSFTSPQTAAGAAAFTAFIAFIAVIAVIAVTHVAGTAGLPELLPFVRLRMTKCPRQRTDAGIWLKPGRTKITYAGPV
jgi:hypothetical protein